MNFKKLNFKSIKNKVIILISTSIALAMLLITFIVILVVNKHMEEQLHSSLKNKTHFIHERINQRIDYLLENSVLLTKNGLMVNALIDSNGRKVYLPQLVENFMEGKDVSYINIIDFEGRAIFQTNENMLSYNESSQLREALAFSQASYYIEKDTNNLVLVSPIEYYNTTQGAAVIVFNLKTIINRLVSNDKEIYIKLLKNNTLVFSYNFHNNTKYTKYDYNFNNIHCHNNICYLKELNLNLEIGTPSAIYEAPLQNMFINLIIIGTLFIVVGVFLSRVLAQNITQPILKLHNRVQSSSMENEIFCSPLGTSDELEDLAKAFDERTLTIQHQTQYDTLTELPNRILFMDRLKQSIDNDEKYALFYINLNNFKKINDSFGHKVGNELLITIGKKLESIIKRRDSLARMGGDEFTILLNNSMSEDKVINVLQKIMNIFVNPFNIDENEFYLTCSIGISIYPIHADTPETLLKNAHTAMYKAKDMGRSNYQFYTEDMTQKAYERVVLETKLKQAISNKEFEVYYQPQVNISDKKIIGMEALVRWNHPTMGLVPPNQFIPLAEETGLIVDIDRQVMQDAMSQFQKWLNDGYDIGIISINLSMVQLVTPDFIDFVKNTINNCQISTSNLMFEVTETQIMKNPEKSIEILKKLQDLGIKLAIDDFGTGHSSLAYIKKLPVNKLKIDQSFVRDIFISDDDRKLTRAIISISKSLNLEVIAEGVETREQAIFLVENGCKEAQGYLYYKPQNANNITQKLELNT